MHQLLNVALHRRCMQVNNYFSSKSRNMRLNETSVSRRRATIMYRAALILILAVPSTAATLRRTVATAAWKSRSLQITTELLTPSERPSTATELPKSSERPTASLEEATEKPTGLTNSSRLPTTTTEISTSSELQKSASELPTLSEWSTGSLKEVTEKPTVNLSNNRTKEPESGRPPIDAPSRKPTNQLNITLTHEPTNKPTGKPTNKPTTQFTDKPTSEPIDISSDRPTRSTNKLINKPTNEPIGKPMKEPTDKPTSDPANIPTISPASFPKSTGGDDDSGLGGFEIDLSDDESPGNKNEVTKSPEKLNTGRPVGKPPKIQFKTSRCDDDENFEHQFNKVDVTCAWLRDEAKAKEKKKFCNRSVSYDNTDQKVKKICSAACEQKCDDTAVKEPAGKPMQDPTSKPMKEPTGKQTRLSFINTTYEPTIKSDEPTEKPMDDIADEPTMEQVSKVTNRFIDSSLSETSEEEISRADFIGIILGAIGGVLAILSTIMMVIFYAYDRDEDKDAFRENMTRYCCFCFATSKAPPEEQVSNRYVQPSGNSARGRMSNSTSTMRRMSNPTPTMMRRQTPGVILSFSSIEHRASMSEI